MPPPKSLPTCSTPDKDTQRSASAPMSSSWFGGASGTIKSGFSGLAGWDDTSTEEGDNSARKSSVGRTPMTVEEGLSTSVMPIFDTATLAMLNHSKESINSLKQFSMVDFDNSNPQQQKSEGKEVEKKKGWFAKQKDPAEDKAKRQHALSQHDGSSSSTDDESREENARSRLDPVAESPARSSTDTSASITDTGRTRSKVGEYAVLGHGRRPSTSANTQPISRANIPPVDPTSARLAPIRELVPTSLPMPDAHAPVISTNRIDEAPAPNTGAGIACENQEPKPLPRTRSFVRVHASKSLSFGPSVVNRPASLVPQESRPCIHNSRQQNALPAGGPIQGAAVVGPTPRRPALSRSTSSENIAFRPVSPLEGAQPVAIVAPKNGKSDNAVDGSAPPFPARLPAQSHSTEDDEFDTAFARAHPRSNEASAAPTAIPRPVTPDQTALYWAEVQKDLQEVISPRTRKITEENRKRTVLPAITLHQMHPVGTFPRRPAGYAHDAVKSAAAAADGMLVMAQFKDLELLIRRKADLSKPLKSILKSAHTNKRRREDDDEATDMRPTKLDHIEFLDGRLEREHDHEFDVPVDCEAIAVLNQRQLELWRRIEMEGGTVERVL